ncbi:MAG: diguanylate cyclase [Gallionella sp.]|jgi:diguanylate cyclase (GGDEF)-like protein
MEYQVFPTIGAIAHKSPLKGEFDFSVQTAAKLMCEQNVSSIVIEQGEDKYIFSIEDILGFVHNGGDCETRLHSAPFRKISCMSENERVLNALDFLEQNEQRYLGVVNQQGEMIGIITYSDLMHSIDPSVLMERKTVGDMISRTTPVMFTADWVLSDVIHHLRRMEDSIIVVESGRPIGIITAKDIFAIVTTEKGTDGVLSSYMTSPVITTPLHCSISDALLQLREHNIKRIIVVDEQQRVAGVVTQSELIGNAYGSWINLMKDHTAELHELIEILEERMRNLERLTVTDILTGLGNRRMLHQQMVEEMERIQRYNASSFSLVIFDIDHFKQINDRFGHLVGDEVLKAIASEIEQLIRRSDTAVRWGGEEFAVLLPNTPVVAAGQFANRLREIIDQFAFGNDVSVTISAGVGEYLSKEDEKSFFQRVDRALYKAKANGRNLVEIDTGW